MLLKKATAQILASWHAMHCGCYFMTHVRGKDHFVVTHTMFPDEVIGRREKTLLMGQFHQFIAAYTRLFCRKCHNHVSTFCLGSGAWCFSGQFRFGDMTQSDTEAIQKAAGGQFSIEKLLGRTAQFGSPALKAHLKPLKAHLKPEPPPGKKLLQSQISFSVTTGPTISAELLGRTAQFGSPPLKANQKPKPQPGKTLHQSQISFSLTKGLTISKSVKPPPPAVTSPKPKPTTRRQTTRLSGSSQGSSTNEKKFLVEYEKLVSIHARLVPDHDLCPPRACWTDVFTYKCTSDPTCWKCRVCRSRFSQIVLVVIAAQGNRDSLCLPHFGAVFRHLRYKHFSIEEWSEIALEELTMVFSQVSKQGISAMYAHLFLKDLAAKNVLPQTVAEIVCYSGFRKKSACLLLDAMGCTTPPGIPVDRHLATGFRALGWVDTSVKSPESLSYMVESWLPIDRWSECNIVCAGLRQVWQCSKHKDKLMKTALNLGTDHLELLQLLCSKSK
jgi:endonuclease III